MGEFLLKGNAVLHAPFHFFATILPLASINDPHTKEGQSFCHYLRLFFIECVSVNSNDLILAQLPPAVVAGNGVPIIQGNSNLCVYVNGVKATVHVDGTWEADDVPVSPSDRKSVV